MSARSAVRAALAAVLLSGGLITGCADGSAKGQDSGPDGRPAAVSSAPAGRSAPPADEVERMRKLVEGAEGAVGTADREVTSDE